MDSATIVGPMVGACPTANRLYKGGLLTSPKCRFWSDCTYEDIRHLTGECRGTRELLGNPGNLFPEQPNFLSHGIREVPQSLLGLTRGREQFHRQFLHQLLFRMRQFEFGEMGQCAMGITSFRRL